MKRDAVIIKTFTHIGEDDRGVTSEFCLLRAQSNFVYIKRKAGTVSGNTYHAGQNQGTNPKIFILLSGEIEFAYRLINSDIKKIEYVSSPAMIEIAPYIIHAVTAKTDIVLLECNSILDIQNDRIKELV